MRTIGVGGQDPGGAEAILGLLSDPKAAEARLKELQEAQRSATEASRAAVTAKAEAEGLLRKAEASRTEGLAAKQAADETLRGFNDRVARLARVEEENSRLATDLERRAAKLVADEKALSEKMARFETEHASRVDTTNRLFSEAKALKTTYEQKLARIKEIAG